MKHSIRTPPSSLSNGYNRYLFRRREIFKTKTGFAYLRSPSREYIRRLFILFVRFVILPTMCTRVFFIRTNFVARNFALKIWYSLFPKDEIHIVLELRICQPILTYRQYIKLELLLYLQ